MVSAVTDPAAKGRGISLFLVDKGLAGFTIGRNQPMMGLGGTTHAEMFFDNVRLDGDCLLGPEGAGPRLAPWAASGWGRWARGPLGRQRW